MDRNPSAARRQTIPRLSVLAMAYLVFFLSGAAALVYEISWSRQIGLILGHTAHAAAAVLSAYFVGLAFGYAIGSRFSGTTRPLAGYALAETIAAAWACVVPWLVASAYATELPTWLQPLFDAAPDAMRWLFCFSVLLPATAALGATLPMMADWLSPPGDATRRRIVAAYSINTVGAFVGAVVATVWLLVYVGVSASSYVAATLSLICAASALLIERLDRATPETTLPAGDERASDAHSRGEALAVGLAPSEGEETPAVSAGSTLNVALAPPTSAEPRSEWRYALVPAAVSGFGVLALEVLYSRLFSLVFHNSTYTFGAVLAATIVALALGSTLAALLTKLWPARRVLPWAAELGAVLTPVSLIVFLYSTKLKYFYFGVDFTQYIFGAFLLVGVVVLPPIMLLGAILPLCWCDDAEGEQAAGESVGRIAFINMLAGALGAAGASLVLLPAAGLWASFAVAALIFLALAIVVARRPVLTALVGGALLALGFSPLMSSQRPEQWLGADGDELVRRWNSAYGWIDVAKGKDHALRVRQNLHYRYGSTGSDRPRAYRQARLPLALHPNPVDACFLGLGTGVTAGGAVADSDLKHGVVVELIPEVIEAARLLKEANCNVVDEPRFEMVVDDGRHYLETTPKQFDVIVADLFVPWESETGYLYTVENYRSTLARLKPGGIFCQWLAVYQMGPHEFELIADSFKTVFPETSLWWAYIHSSRPILALVGSREPLAINQAQLDARLKTIFAQTTPDEEMKSPERLVNLYLGEWQIRQPGYLNTDEHPRVEFLTPASQINDRLLQGDALREYYDRVLANLPDCSASFGVQRESPQSARAWHRLRLFPLESPQSR